MADLEFVHAQYEQDNYYTIASSDKAQVELEWGFRWRHILEKIRARHGRARVLDVGAGNGYFVFLARSEFGFDAQGVEISDAEIRYAREQFGVELLKSPLAALPTDHDVVCSFNVIEHVADPAGLLQDLHARLRPGGSLFLSTPNPACIHRRRSGLRNWGMVDPPHHINLFPRRALQELLELSGFSIDSYTTLSTYIRFVRKYDTRNLLLRRTLFNILRAGNLGADHFFICTASGPPATSPVRQ
ncbi:MAG TPA: class I SAM-dependent methyltransferase [Steroidobacteraceae bacterium]|nr:class I SAM-dependent methyltransferase [Steroidobacteraceae bacterium]